MFEWDRSLFEWINRWPDELAPMFRFFSIGIKGTALKIILGFAAVALIAWPRTRKATLFALISWPLANAITDVLKAAFPALRPCVDFPDAIVRVEQLTSLGTASAHSANMAAVAFAYAYTLRPGRSVGLWALLAAWIAVALLTGLSRIYVGVHYPAQVLAGWLVGCLAAWVVIRTWMAFSRVRSLRAETQEGPEPTGSGP